MSKIGVGGLLCSIGGLALYASTQVIFGPFGPFVSWMDVLTGGGTSILAALIVLHLKKV